MPTVIHNHDRVRVSETVSRARAVQPLYLVTAHQGWAQGGSGEPYSGTYEVTPTTAEQILATRRRFLSDDVTVHKIPYYEASNPQGGMTVSIAS